MTRPPGKTGEQIRAERLEREAREAKDAAEQAVTAKAGTGTGLAVIGIAIMIAGVYFLIVDPSGGDAYGRSVVNLQRLYLGQTAAIIGAIFFAAGVHLRNS